ncbi:hypothetical protein RINTU1_13290 [Candidatus Regiella insecticola]|uniref:Uncharacterized protein n=1 Tax=Candidatus Regiella insecticola TaxID=138073 RepID=A0A6L2ZNV5_9ENTR|nr:hypothetical protein RINTU1_13290 [Candidatus Regiella insecticola]
MSILCFLPPYFESIYILLALMVADWTVRRSATGRIFSSLSAALELTIYKLIQNKEVENRKRVA